MPKKKNWMSRLKEDIQKVLKKDKKSKRTRATKEKIKRLRRAGLTEKEIERILGKGAK